MSEQEQAANRTHYISFSAEVSQQTTEALLGACANIHQEGYDTIYLMLSTPGGSVMNGVTIYHTLRALPIKVITHNMGNVNSIGNVIFVAGDERYSCKHATFMFHGVGFDISQPMRFEEKLLRERLDSVRSDQSTIGGIITDRTEITPDEIKELFLEATTRDPEYAKTKGLIDDIRDVQIPRGAPLFQLVFKR